jgi:lipid II:glycine glycyltransferase (peptidoglycan interpeptide bridge formation enzyme)
MGAVLDGELMALRLVLRWGGTLYDWYAGSDLDQPTHADEWLVWQVLRQGIREGCNTFDFGGAGKPDEPYGPREFKRRFGGQAVNPGRFEKVYRPLTFRATKAAYKAWRLLQ